MPDILVPRPGILSRSVDGLEAGILGARDEPLENPSKVLEAALEDARLWERMITSEPVVSSGVRFHTERLTGEGGGFVAGAGKRAELYRRIAAGLWGGIRQRSMVEDEIASAWAVGYNVHEMVGLRIFRIDGVEYVGPKTLQKRPAEGYGFTQRDDLVLLAHPVSGDEVVYRTESVQDHPHGLKWLVTSRGSTRSLYGKAGLGDVWVFWSLLGEYREGLKAGLLATNGILKLTDQGISGAGSDAKVTLGDLERQMKDVMALMRSTGILGLLGGMDGDLMDNQASGDAWLKAIDGLEKGIRIRLVGSETPQASTNIGGFAMARVQNEATIKAAKADAEAMEETITRWVTLWLRRNLKHLDIDDEELPRWESNLGKKPSIEEVQLAISSGLRVDGKAYATQRHVDLIEGKPDEDIVMSAPAAPAVVSPAEEEDDEVEPAEDPADDSGESE